MAELTRLLVAIVTYNSARVIEPCLAGFEYLGRLPTVAAEVVVADNASVDETVPIVERFMAANPGLPVRLVRCDRNGGWGAGNNAAIRARQADPDFVLLCNPDAGLPQEALTALLHALGSGPRGSAIAVPFLVGRHGVVLGANPEWSLAKFLVWDYVSGRPPYRRFQRRYRGRGRIFEIRDGYASGALLLVSFAALRDIGFFDERLFLFNDDLDMTRSIRARGGRLVGVPSAKGHHEGGGGSEIGPEREEGTSIATLALGSELQFASKWYGRRRARALARYRLHVFFPLQSTLLRLSRKGGYDTRPFAAVAREFLDGSEPHRSTRHG